MGLQGAFVKIGDSIKFKGFSGGVPTDVALPEMPKKSRKCRLMPPAPKPRKVQKVSGTVRKASCDTFRKLPRLFPRLFGLFGVPAPEAPGDIFKTFRHFGPEEPERFL